jgi:hypothetical protein
MSSWAASERIQQNGVAFVRLARDLLEAEAVKSFPQVAMAEEVKMASAKTTKTYNTGGVIDDRK